MADILFIVTLAIIAILACVVMYRLNSLRKRSEINATRQTFVNNILRRLCSPVREVIILNPDDAAFEVRLREYQRFIKDIIPHKDVLYVIIERPPNQDEQEEIISKALKQASDDPLLQARIKELL